MLLFVDIIIIFTSAPKSPRSPCGNTIKFKILTEVYVDFMMLISNRSGTNCRLQYGNLRTEYKPYQTKTLSRECSGTSNQSCIGITETIRRACISASLYYRQPIFQRLDSVRGFRGGGTLGRRLLLLVYEETSSKTARLTFADACNALRYRLTTKPGDAHGIFGLPAGLSIENIISLDRSQRMEAAIHSQMVLPASVLIICGPKLTDDLKESMGSRAC